MAAANNSSVDYFLDLSFGLSHITQQHILIICVVCLTVQNPKILNLLPNITKECQILTFGQIEPVEFGDFP